MYLPYSCYVPSLNCVTEPLSGPLPSILIKRQQYFPEGHQRTQVHARPDACLRTQGQLLDHFKR